MELVYPVGMEQETTTTTTYTHSIMSMSAIQTQESVDEGPSTAQIIAAQSQDYVDERLAEYQATIQHLQGRE